MLNICLLGTGGVEPSYLRNLTAMLAQVEGSNILIDCGEGTQVAIQKSPFTANPIDVICITHCHADHISGLMGVLLAMKSCGRTKKVQIVCHKTVERSVNLILQILPKLGYEIEFISLFEDKHVIKTKNYNIIAFKVYHSTHCYGFSIEVPRLAKFDIEKAKALPVPIQAWGILQKGSNYLYNDVTYTPDMVLGEDRKGLKVTYCTDSRPTESIIENAMDSDLFICEGMYFDNDKFNDAKKKKHMMMSEAAHLAQKSNVKEMWLTHFSPQTFNPSEHIDVIQKIFKNTKIVKDGTTLNLGFED